MIDKILSAARAEHIPEGQAGLWFITKLHLKAEVQTPREVLPPGVYTHLFRVTDSTLHNHPPGEVVMEDTPSELRKHLEFMLKAKGNVLVTGLGLGCVVRGLLANPNVKHVTCIEKSPDVLKMVGPYMPQNKLTIVRADALEWVCKNTTRFDYAWHDLWTDRDNGEPHLDLWHTQLMFNCAKYVGHQGAWGFSRYAKRLVKRTQVRWI